MTTVANALYYGDNLEVLRRYIKDGSVDLIYLDPPFNSNQNYNILFAEQDGSRAAAQIKAFGDTWAWDLGSAKAYRDVVESGGKVSQVMQAFHTFLGENDMLSYLAMMAPRLIELKRVLKSTGSIYLHCDPTASHYLKLLLDAVFGFDNYRNEIIWHRGTGFKRKTAKNFPSKSDTILFYTKTSDYNFKTQYKPHKPEYLARFKPDEKGRLRRTDVNPTKGGTRTIYLDDVEGDIIDSVWYDIPPINPVATERLGYPTQKPERLLERIINSSSNEGDVILDPFCGCGTAIAVSERLKRHWIGIDITHLAITLIKNRLKDMTNGKAKYVVIGEPVTLPDAEMLATQDKYQFQWWALGLVGARPADPKKGADKGIDGRIYFHDESDATKTKQIILSVKGGKLKPDDIRALKGVVDRENAQMGILISFEQPTKPMKADAAGGGFYHSPGYDQDYPALQIITVEELLGGKRIDMPPQQQVSTTFKKAPRAKEPRGQNLKMPLE